MGTIAPMLKSLNQIRLEKKSIFKFYFKKYYDIPSDTWFGDTVYYYILRYLKQHLLNYFLLFCALVNWLFYF